LPDVTYDLGLSSVSFVVPADQTYTQTFKSKGDPMALEVVKGVGNETPVQAVRYLDLNLPAGTTVTLGLTSDGIANLAYDGDGDGIFESQISPTAAAIGVDALDTEAPVITFTEKAHDNNRLITLVPMDNQSGVRSVRYSLDGQKYQTYAAPLSIDACQVRTIYAFADDNVANRSGVFAYELPNLPPDVSHARPSIATLWPPDHKMVEVSVLGVTDPDCDSVTITITRITQDEPTNGTGDGDACPDGLGIGTVAAQLRAERSGAENGRVYSIYFSATDGKGGTSQGVVKVGVPKAMYQNVVEDGSAFDSTMCSVTGN